MMILASIAAKGLVVIAGIAWMALMVWLGFRNMKI